MFILAALWSAACFTPRLLEAATIDPMPLVASIQLGGTLNSYPLCDSGQGSNKICRFNCAGDHCMISYRPEFPSWAKMAAMASSKQGVITEVVIPTKGYRVADELLTQLTAEYGKPQKLTKSIVQNAFGATFPKLEASWSLSWGTVQFESIKQNLDEGELFGALNVDQFPALPEAASASSPAAIDSQQLVASSPNATELQVSSNAESPKAAPRHSVPVHLGIQFLTADTIAGKLALVPESGVKILGMEEHGTGARSGLRVGDIITAVNGERVPSVVKGLQALLGRIPPEMSITLSVNRQGEDISLPILFP